MGAPPLEYSHRFHVGNHGDVWKHVALVSLLHHLGRAAPRVLDTHAGEGMYRLGPTGEWTAGVGQIWDDPPADIAVSRWLTAIAATGAGPRQRYPGSPRLILDAIGPHATLTACELQTDAAAALRKNLSDPRLTVVQGDGLHAAVPADLVLIDPPYARPDEWPAAADAVIAVRQRPERPCVALWYPIKAWNRPNALLARMRGCGEPWVAVDLVITPVELRRPQLAGSGLLLLGAPDPVVPELLAAAAALGPRLATHDRRWQLRVQAEHAIKGTPA